MKIFFNPKNEEKSVSSTESNNNFDLRPEDDGHPIYSDEEEVIRCCSGKAPGLKIQIG